MWDTIPIVTYSKNKIIITNEKSEIAIWRRLSAKTVKKYRPSQRH